MNIKEILTETDYDRPYQVSVQKIGRIYPHYHSNALELVYCLGGSVTIASSHQKVVLNEGELFTLDFDDIHYLYSDTDNTTLIFNLDLTKLSIPWDDLKYHFFTCESYHCYPYQQKPMEQVKDIVLSLAYAALSAGTGKYGKGDLRAVDRLVSLFIKYFCWLNYQYYDDYINENFYNRYYHIQGYCIENFREKITVAKLAQMEHISENYLSQFMSKTAFYSYSQMIGYIRCYEAEHMLLLTDMPNYDISYACGFSDPKYFYKTFRSWWGCTPTEHRTACREYMKQPERYMVLPDEDAAAFVREYITDYHIKKVFR